MSGRWIQFHPSSRGSQLSGDTGARQGLFERCVRRAVNFSCFVCKYEGVTFSNTDLVRRFIKGTFEQNPTFPKQLKETWDVNTVLTIAEHLDASRRTDPKGANFEVSDAYGPIVGTEVSDITRTGHSTPVSEGQKV